MGPSPEACGRHYNTIISLCEGRAGERVDAVRAQAAAAGALLAVAVAACHLLFIFHASIVRFRISW